MFPTSFDMNITAIADRLAYMTPAELAELGTLLENDPALWCELLERLAQPKLPSGEQEWLLILSAARGKQPCPSA